MEPDDQNPSSVQLLIAYAIFFAIALGGIYCGLLITKATIRDAVVEAIELTKPRP